MWPGDDELEWWPPHVQSIFAAIGHAMGAKRLHPETLKSLPSDFGTILSGHQVLIAHVSGEQLGHRKGAYRITVIGPAFGGGWNFRSGHLEKLSRAAANAANMKEPANDTFARVEEHLRPWARGKPITLDTELYRDLGMYGDDLFFDVVMWAEREFGVIEGRFYVAEYGPPEMTFYRPRRWLRRLFGMKERRYKSLTVRTVVAAIEAKRWPE